MISPAILLVSAKEDFLRQAASLLLREGFTEIAEAKNSGEALRKLGQGEIALAVVSSGLQDRSSLELVELLTEQKIPTVFLIASERFDLAQDSFVATNVLVLQKPVARQTFSLALALMNQIINFRRNKTTAQNKEFEEKIIGGAKNFLMNSFEMTEPKAHRFLQKTSMNLRVTLAEAAEAVFAVQKKPLD